MIEVHPSGAALGAEVLGVGLDDAAVDAIRTAWHAHLVLLFRDQRLDPERLAAFSRHFGEPDVVPAWRDMHPPGVPQVLISSNVEKGGRAVGVLGSGDAEWHTDLSYLEDPPVASVLNAIEVPKRGGKTSFLNIYKAFDALPGNLREPVADGEALLGRLWTHCCGDDYVWVHRWRVGDVLMWDNRCTMHRRDAFDARARRRMHRTQIRSRAGS